MLRAIKGRRHKSEHAGAGLRGLQKRALTLFEANTAKEGACWSNTDIDLPCVRFETERT